MNGPDKLDCYISFGNKGYPRTKTLAYCPLHKLQIELDVVNCLFNCFAARVSQQNSNNGKLFWGTCFGPAKSTGGTFVSLALLFSIQFK